MPIAKEYVVKNKSVKYIVKYLVNNAWLIYKCHGNCRTLDDALVVARKAVYRENTSVKIIKSVDDDKFTDVIILKDKHTYY